MFDSPAGARFSRCGTYRYVLWRRWDPTRPASMIIGLNPSTADARNNDPTIRRCIRFARDWGSGGLIMTNLFAFRATDPSDLKKAEDPVGPRNDFWVRSISATCPVLVAAWGNDGAWQGRSTQLCQRLGHRLQILRLNKSGEPAHPLYLPAGLRPRPWIEQHDSDVDRSPMRSS